MAETIRFGPGLIDAVALAAMLAFYCAASMKNGRGLRLLPVRLAQSWRGS